MKKQPKPDYKMLFLRQSYLDSTDEYEKILETNPKNNDGVKIWDYVVLTASNSTQAEAYRAQINNRIKENRLPIKTKYLVVPDREGKRVGSGGATLSVLREIALKEYGNRFDSLRILCIHSGGDSKRIPQYSACGKIFSPVPRVLPKGNRSTLFDEIMIGTCGIPSKINSGMMVCSGDVLVLFNSLQLNFYGDYAAALSVKESVKSGENHGVFLGDENGLVKMCLQKQSERILRSVGATDDNDCVDIDTGAVILCGKIVSDLYSLVDTDEKYDDNVNERVRLSFYTDFLYPLALDSTLENFYLEKPENDFCPELTASRERIWNKLRGYNMKLIRFSPAAFLHFGTTSELLSLMTLDMSDYKYLDWNKVVNSNYHGSKFSAYNSYISKNCKIGKDCYIENSDVLDGVIIGERCVISGVTLNNVTVPSDTVLHGIKLKGERYVCRRYAVNDNPKNNVFMGKNINEPLWTKPLFKSCTNMADAVKSTLSGNYDGELLSLKDCFLQSDPIAEIMWSDKLDDKIIAETILEAVDSRQAIDDVKKTFPHGVSERVERYLLKLLSKKSDNELDDFSRKIRVYYYTSKLIDEQNLSDLCFDEIRRAVLSSDIIGKKQGDLRIAKNEVVIRLPVRVNWGGGWSDTPPYCIENGGTVLNAAIKLNGELPIEVTIKRTDNNCIALASTDIGSYAEFYDVNDLTYCSDPSDAFALHKAALIACGIVPSDGSQSIGDICDKIGGGIYMNTRVINIPKGSGLGTSSILAGACVKALSDFFAINIDNREIVNRVLCMEQLMSTGGGWQDQIGGIVPGIKLSVAAPSFRQDITSTPLNLRNEVLQEINERFVLIYTGQRRLARNLLRDVVGKYVGGDSIAIDVLNKIQQLAVLMRFELERGNVDAFASLLNEHWELSKKLDSGCTNTCIDQIFISVEDLIDGKMICGAGGGGFLQVVLKKGIKKSVLSKRLRDVFADSGISMYDCELYM